MGLTPSAIAFLAIASQREADFGSTLTIGRQRLLCTPRSLHAALRDAGMRLDRSQALALIERGAGFAEPVLQRLGARRVDSLDASDYEGATHVHDLNRPLPTELRAKYSAVVDGGSLEHVFNFPLALTGCLEAVALGGHYLAMTPVNNWPGHGFYQFSPELYFRVLDGDNGFAMRCMLWRPETPLGRWYQVADPAAVARRVERRGAAPALLYVAARRTELRAVLADPPQQSDYLAAWEASAARARATNEIAIRDTTARRIYRHSPFRIKTAWRWLRWGGLPPAAEDTRRFIEEMRRIQSHRDDFKRVALRDAAFT